MNCFRCCAVLIAVQIATVFCYKAAVYEHEVMFPIDRAAILSREQALHEMSKNLQVYETQCLSAARKGVQIIVFPEYGIIGLSWSRKTIVPYLEFIPDPLLQSWNPCDKPNIHNNTDVQRTLSCMAKNSSLFLVANIGARQPCDLSTDPDCPADGHYHYSTNVVYDPSGKFVARYFKYNINQYERLYFDRPKHADYIVFDTPFGKFGTFTSYDIFYHDPVVPLVNKMAITNVVYPTAWQDELPLYNAIEFHSAFAEGMQITMLAANLHRPVENYHGSGIYWPVGTGNAAVYCYNSSVGSSGELVITDFKRNINVSHSQSKKKHQKIPKTKFDNTRNYQSKLEHFHKEIQLPYRKIINRKTVQIQVNHDVYNVVLLRSVSYGSFSVCHGKLCCRADYEGMFNNTLYALGAFDGLHTYGGTYYLQVCTFFKCANNSVESCGQPAAGNAGYMSKMSFAGNFMSDRIFPEVLLRYDNSYQISTMTWLYQDAIIIDVGVPGSPISISMIGRNYTLDKGDLP